MPQYLKCLATVPCDLLLITISVSNCRLFSGINILQGIVATNDMFKVWWDLFSYHCTANLSLSLTVMNFDILLKFDKVTTMSLVAYFFGTQCIFEFKHCKANIMRLAVC